MVYIILSVFVHGPVVNRGQPGMECREKIQRRGKIWGRICVQGVMCVKSGRQRGCRATSPYHVGEHFATRQKGANLSQNLLLLMDREKIYKGEAASVYMGYEIWTSMESSCNLTILCGRTFCDLEAGECQLP